MWYFLQFQFHEGPIKTSFGGAFLKWNFGFNSMKVRLKRVGLDTLVILE